MNAPIPTAPAVAIETAPVVSEAEMARVVPTWAFRLAQEDDGAPYIGAARFLACGYSPYSRDKAYKMLGRYCDRIERLTERRGVALLSLAEQMPKDGELPGRRDGHSLFVSKRLYIRSVLGYLPRMEPQP